MPSLRKLLQKLPLLGPALLLAHAAAAQTTLQDICGDCVLEEFASCGGFLEGASVDANNRLWVVDLIGGNILSVADNGQCSVEASTGGQPNGAKFHRDGRLFIADKALGIMAYNPRDKSITPIVNSHRSETLRGVNDLVFDANGGLYFTEPYGSGTLNPNGRVFYLPSDGSALRVVGENFAFPNGIALSMDGSRLYVGEYANKRIVSLPSQTSQDIFDVSFVFSQFEGGIGPDGFALDTAGNVYAAIFQSGSVQIADSLGFPVGTIRLPAAAGTFVTNLTFKDGYLYITEASQGKLWRVKVSQSGLPLFHQQ